ncbi:MAG: CPXCG motif-containing cysteine-rich protein [Chloracidobacterium sp.]|nr:CPXCG motif-containing cysteine-rich protein [Chloracidobacterium sp.]MDW8215993.1 CPXCG motif-containing cysteine-rich protein [Acidobacteriota bacterium]
MQDAAEYLCMHCGEPNVTFPDWSGGRRQRYIEDCAVCCRPNVLHVTLDPVRDQVTVYAEPE